LANFIEQTLSSFVLHCGFKNIVIHQEIAGDLIKTILGDPTRLRQIIITLAGNAIKFTHTGSVPLFLAKHHNYLQITVMMGPLAYPSKRKQTQANASKRKQTQAKLFEPYV
jgi:signal transduction histidine kinase